MHLCAFKSRAVIRSKDSVVVCAFQEHRDGPCDAVQMCIKCWLNTAGSSPWPPHLDQCLHRGAPAAAAAEVMGAPALLQCLLKEVSAYHPVNTGQHIINFSSSRSSQRHCSGHCGSCSILSAQLYANNLLLINARAALTSFLSWGSVPTMNRR